MIRQEEVYRIGKIGKPHGVKGEVSMMFTDDVFDRVEAEYLVLDTDGILVPFFMEEYRFRSNETALVKFLDVDTQEQARALTGCEVYFPHSLSDSGEESLTWARIAGYTVTDTRTGRVVGTLKRVDDTTVNTLFEVETADGRELLVPAPEELVEDIDPGKREIKLHVPDGILEL